MIGASEVGPSVESASDARPGAGDDRGLPCELIAHDFLPAFDGAAGHRASLWATPTYHCSTRTLDISWMSPPATYHAIGAIICASATARG
jgi:hypothetical protein